MRPCSLVHRDFKRLLALILWALTDGRNKLLSHIFADFKSKFLTVNPSKAFMSYVSFYSLSNSPLEADDSVLTSIEAIAGDIDGHT